MRLFIHSQDSQKIKSLRSVIETKLADVLTRFGPQVSRATVYLADQNGPRGGVDKLCRIVVKLRRQGEITVEDRACRWFSAVTGALGRLRNSIHRKLAKWRTTRTRSPKPRKLVETDMEFFL